MKVLAMYLPQFHKVKENSEWWGEGFTDWDSARDARPLFEGHYQPHIPLRENYYDLLKKETMKWQTDLMHKYGVDGACIYHYWFKDGRKILERPAENLLQWTDIDLPYCFCWANETWARSWSGLQNSNIWSAIREKSDNRNKKAVLLEQQYGNKNEWEKHFVYLLPFFMDPRYIKVDGRPVFVIYKTFEVTDLKGMISCWRRMAKMYDVKEPYIIGANPGLDCYGALDAELYHETGYGRGALCDALAEGSIRCVDYQDMWKNILRERGERIKTYYGGIVSYDDTPRQGRKGLILDKAFPEVFGKYFTELMAKNSVAGNEFVFLNAWNEWGEGMHLEPDKKYGFRFLEEVLKARQRYPEHIEKYQKLFQNPDKYLIYLEKNKHKFGHYMTLLDKWMSLREQKISIEQYLLDHGFCKVLVYGYGILGKHLLNELKESVVEIVGIIDKKGKGIQSEYQVYTPEDEFPEADVIIVTSYYFFKEIEEEIGEKGYELISLQKIIETVMEKKEVICQEDGKSTR